MKPVKDFYEKLHSTEAGYSAGIYDMPALFRNRAFRGWAQRHQSGTPRLLDVGVGKGLFLRDVVRELGATWSARPAKTVGLDLVRSPGDVFADIPAAFEFLQHDTDGQRLPFEDAAFDFISCNHVLEHVFETEMLVREFRRVLAPGGLCLISVPNTAAWINRVAFFLWGNQPLGSEIGTETITYGFRPRFLQKKLARFRPSGHIRDFCPRGLQDLCEACGFTAVGWWKQNFGLLAALNKWAGRNIAILMEPGAVGVAERTG
jgi:SAM-dependent methyltransferase